MGSSFSLGTSPQKIVTKMDETKFMFIELKKIIMYHEK